MIVFSILRIHDTRHTTHDTRHTTHDTRHTTHGTRHTTHGTRHTTHDTRHTMNQTSTSAKTPELEPGQKLETIDLALFVKAEIVILEDPNPNWGSATPRVRLLISYPLDPFREKIRQQNCSYQQANDMFLAVMERGAYRPHEVAALPDFWQQVGVWAALIRKASTGGLADRPEFVHS